MFPSEPGGGLFPAPDRFPDRFYDLLMFQLPLGKEIVRAGPDRSNRHLLVALCSQQDDRRESRTPLELPEHIEP